MIINFLIAAAISFIGSLQPGPVNLRVIQTTYNLNFKSALMVAVGAMFPELIYAGIAAWYSSGFTSDSRFVNIIQIIAAPFFFISGIVLIFKKSNKVLKIDFHPVNFILSGFLAGILNPLLIAFWIIVINYLNVNGMISIESTNEKVFFVTGAAVGAFLLLTFYAYLTQHNKDFLNKIFGTKMNKFVGSVFIIFAIIAFYRLLF